MPESKQRLGGRVHEVVMLPNRERRNFLDHFPGPARVRCPDFTRTEQIRNSIQAHQLVISSAGAELLHGNPHVAQLLDQRAAGGFLLHNERIWLPLFVVLERCGLEVRERHAVLERVQQDHLRRVVLLLVVEHAPRGARAVVGVVLHFKGRVPALDHVVAARWVLARPDAPHLPADDRAGLGRGLLHVLGVPILGVQRGFCRLEGGQRPLLGPQRLLVLRVLVQDGRKLHDLPWLGLGILGLIRDQAPSQVQERPPRHDHYDRTARHQSLERARLEPRPRSVESQPAVGLHVLFRVRIVNYEQVSTTASKSAAHTSRVILTAGACGPLARSLLVVSHHCLGKNLTVLLRVQQVTDTPSEVFRQTGRVRAHDDLFLGVFTQKIGREEVGAELRLAHTGRDVDDDTLFSPLNHVREDSGQLPVVGPDLEARVDRRSEAQHVVLGRRQACATLPRLQIVEQLHLLLDGHRRQCAFERLQLTLGQRRQFLKVHLESV